MDALLLLINVVVMLFLAPLLQGVIKTTKARMQGRRGPGILQPYRDILKWLGIEPLLSRRGDDERGLGVWRWFVERTISWLHQFRRLRMRWDRRPEIHQAFLSLAAGVICYRMWINES